MLMLLTTCSMASYAHDFQVDGIYYNITSASKLEVEVTHWGNFSGALNYKAPNTTPYSGKIIIPEKVPFNNREYTVVRIGKVAFGAGTYSYGVSDVGFSGGTNVSEIILPNSIKTIGMFAFCGCSNLRSVKFSSELQEIERYAFSGTSITSIHIPDKVIYVRNRAFWRCSRLQYAIIGRNVEALGIYTDDQGVVRYDGCFRECSKLQEVYYLGHTKPYTDSWTFKDCHPALEQYLVRGYISFDKYTFSYTGESPSTNWSNRLKQLSCSLDIPKLEKEAGKYEVICKANFSGSVDFVCDIPYTYTINKAPLTITATDKSKTYGDENPAFDVTFSGFVNDESKSVLSKCELSTTATTSSDAGTYPITILADAKNYDITAVNGTLTINKAPLTVTVVSSEKVYGDENPAFAVTYSGLKNNDTNPKTTKAFSYTTEANKLSGVGSYPVTASNGEFKNYEVTKYNAGTLTVKKAPLSVSCNDATKVYGDVNPTFSFTYSGFKNNDTEDNAFTLKPSVDTEVNKRSNVGE